MSPMQFGIVIPLKDALAAVELAVEAERAGWDGFFLGEAIWSVDPWVTLTAAAVRTARIRLGTMLTPMPLVRPWKLASEAATLDHISGGRVTLSLGMGAVWMGWQAFPGQVSDTRARAEMLDEGIDVLDILFRSAQEDYAGAHYQLKLSAMETVHYPPPTVQRPRIPIWAVGVWPRERSMRRVLKCDGLIPHVMGDDGQMGPPKPDDIRAMAAYVAERRTRATPFDIVVEGSTAGMRQAQAQETVAPWAAAGATWWMETLFGVSDEQLRERVRQGPPR